MGSTTFKLGRQIILLVGNLRVHFGYMGISKSLYKMKFKDEFIFIPKNLKPMPTKMLKKSVKIYITKKKIHFYTKIDSSQFYSPQSFWNTLIYSRWSVTVPENKVNGNWGEKGTPINYWRECGWYNPWYNSMEIPQLIKVDPHTTQRSHSWKYIQSKWNQHIEEILTISCL